MLILSKYPTDWASYPMIKKVFDQIVGDNVLVVDTIWSTMAEYKDNIDRWLSKPHHKVIVMNWWDEFPAHNDYVGQYGNNDRVLILDYMASWFNICDEKFVQYSWEQVQPSTFKNVFLCYQGKWKYNRDALFKSLHNWSVPGIITLAGEHILKDNIPAHEGNDSIYNPGPEESGYYPNDIYSLGDIDVWNSHFLNIVTETLDGSSYPTWISEKTIKPMIGSRPFVIYGDPNIVDVLHSYGLETFDDELDWPTVDYEDNKFPMYHYQRINIKTGLKNLYRQDLKSLYKKCLPKLEHNFHAWRKVAKDQYVTLIGKVSAFVS